MERHVFHPLSIPSQNSDSYRLDMSEVLWALQIHALARA
jgi:hypothetical protein